MQVSELMRKDVITVEESANVREICKVLSKHRMSGAPVLNKSGKLVGFISERDIIAAVPKAGFIKKTAKQLMTKNVRTIEEDAPLTHASKIFSEELYRSLPVTKEGKLVGMVSRNDVVSQMMKHYY